MKNKTRPEKLSQNQEDEGDVTAKSTDRPRIGSLSRKKTMMGLLEKSKCKSDTELMMASSP